jgi:hypothetical protein
MQQTKPDPYFEEWKENAWQRPSQCHGKLAGKYEYFNYIKHFFTIKSFK